MRQIHYFLLKENGKLYWIPEMPGEPEDLNGNAISEVMNLIRNGRYQKALQSAIDSAVEVANQEELKQALHLVVDPSFSSRNFYSLLCSVEKKETPDNRDGKMVALVTFSKPEEKCPTCGDGKERMKWKLCPDIFHHLSDKPPSEEDLRFVASYQRDNVHYIEEPEEKETQEENLSDILSQFRSNQYDQKYSPETAVSDQVFIQSILEQYTITRKEK